MRDPTGGFQSGGLLRHPEGSGQVAKTKPRKPPAAAIGGEPMRVAKAIARAGLCSRREAERWIEAGRIAVNGKTLDTPACVVGPGDQVTVDGEPLAAPERVRAWRFHKPRGLVTTHRDPEGRKTVFDSLPEELPRVMSVGRLDIATEGLLLLVTDGALARHMELPATGWLRRYRVRAKGRITQEALDDLKTGITIDGVSYGAIEAKLDRAERANIWLTMGLREGKNREVKRVLGALGLDVNRLIRVSYGPFILGNLATGAIEEVRTKVLADQLGPKLAQDFGLVAKRKSPPKTKRRPRS